MYNPRFYNNFHGDFTFQAFPQSMVPPPPLPPPYYIPPTGKPPQKHDEEFIKQFESRIPLKPEILKVKPTSISEAREQLKQLVTYLNEIKEKERVLSENTDTLTEHDWNSMVEQIENNKAKIQKSMSVISDSYLDVLKRLITKRAAKRQRLKRMRIERKREREESVKESKEMSRKMEEKIQQIKDAVNRAKQEEEAKLQADVVLKEVLRKKHDAKKCITKLDALVKLRKARANTARGRGESVSESDVMMFNTNIEKLKSFWAQKLTVYEQEENELRDKLKDSDDSGTANDMEKEVENNLRMWREFLFGDSEGAPQKDFARDVERFVCVRSQWDQFISSEGSALPVGWVLPALKK